MGTGNPARIARLGALAVAVGVLLSGCIWDLEHRLEDGLIEHEFEGPFYELPAELPAGEPGALIRTEPILSAPFGTSAWRVIYHSRDLAGNDIPVSAVVIEPDGPAPAHGRPVLSWAHPTTGAAAHCAPSLGVDPFLLIEGLHEFLDAGFTIAATDYPGMGVAGASSYLLGVTEGNSVLDAARAARNLPDAHAGEDLWLWGHSQGGQAALFAAQDAATYAPELTLHGVAVAAPAATLTTLMSDDIANHSGVAIASYAFPAFEAAYADRFSHEEMQAILTPAGQAAVPQIEQLCLLSQNSEVAKLAEPLVGGFVTSDPSTTEPWRTMLEENSAGGKPIGAPIFVAQGLADSLVIPDATVGFVTSLCAAGEHVDFHTFEGVDHGFIADVALPSLFRWIGDVRGDAVPDTCAQ
jgi:pimeloyl-ACP methyl ester carboxylesterase